MEEIYVLKLYITGNTPRSIRAMMHLRQICERYLGKYQLTIINVLEEPELAEQNKIMATPTLVKDAPAPMQRVMGDLSDKEVVLAALGLTAEQQD